MNAKELIEAAKRGPLGRATVNDVKAMSAYILATVREDDEELVEIAEVREAINNLDDDEIEWHSEHLANGLVYVGLECTVRIKTRRQLRRIISALKGERNEHRPNAKRF